MQDNIVSGLLIILALIAWALFEPLPRSNLETVKELIRLLPWYDKK
jgi:hypothetical protein